MSLACRNRSLKSVVFATLLPLSATAALAESGNGREFVLQDGDGYGIEECMRPGMECGRIMADAWCEAHGKGHAAAFGSGDDVTGSTRISATDAVAHVPANAVVIRCGE